MFQLSLALTVGLFLQQIFIVSVVESWKQETTVNPCPLIVPRKFINFAPKGNLTAGEFTEEKRYTNIKTCTRACCQKSSCNVVFMHKTICYHIECISNDLCLPVYRPDMNEAVMVYVRTVNDMDSWADIINDSISPLNHFVADENTSEHYDNFDDRYTGYSDDMLADETNDGALISSHFCSPNLLNPCKQNEECILDKQDKDLMGKCQCISGYTRNASGVCQKVVIPIKLETSTSKPALKQLTVSAMSKEVRLPENEVTLSAYSVPNPPEDQHYTYKWILLSRPEKSDGTMVDQNDSTLHLTHLTEGLYTFRVTVSGVDSFGETQANVSVLPAKRINRPPVVIITPATQIVRLPNTGAVLDGSSSRDDDAIKSWRWELQHGPVGYTPHLAETSTLQLTDLSFPGNYTFRLTVTDTDNATNSTTANITVMKVTDYPPVANAGQDVIFNLPQKELVLNGNLSTDDHEITSWEWTKSPGDADKAADMQDTRTPYLRLSHLEEGMYTFVLKVTDSAGQSSSADVHVFVKPATKKPPVAQAGNDISISLPQTWAILDGTGTSENNHVVKYHWEKIEGPSTVVFETENSSKTNVTNLTRGHYVFKLSVMDDSGNSASDTMSVNVTQVRNERPKANAGGDQTIILPKSLVVLNGSLSHDDVGIVSWQWTREDVSLAIGNILDNSDQKSVLMLSDLAPGRYVFRLKVTDEEGVTDEDTASLMVKPDPLLLNVVQLTLGTQTKTLTQSQIKGVMQELGLLVRDEATLSIQSIRTEYPGGRAVLSLLGKSGSSLLPGLKVERLLKNKLRRESSLLRVSVASIQTAVCQNNCSNHGVCNELTRKCLCDAFWMQNLFEKYLGNGEADCEWSVLYVVVGICTSVLFVCSSVWGIAFLCSRACHHRRIRSSNQRPPRYALLGDDEQPNFNGPKLTMSDSETDSDVLFETRTKNGRRELIGNGHSKATRNGFLKLGRRIKT